MTNAHVNYDKVDIFYCNCGGEIRTLIDRIFQTDYEYHVMCKKCKTNYCVTIPAHISDHWQRRKYIHDKLDMLINEK